MLSAPQRKWMKEEMWIAGLVVIALIGVLIYFMYRWGLFGKKKDSYSQLGSNCEDISSPVDYAYNWVNNPQYLVNSLSKYQPLEYGLDLYSDERKLGLEKFDELPMRAQRRKPPFVQFKRMI